MKFRKLQDERAFSFYTGVIIKVLQFNPDVRMTTKYLSPQCTIKATRQRRPDNRDKRETFLVSVGTPNYLERRFIKNCIKAEVLFPVKKVQLKFYPKKK